MQEWRTNVAPWYCGCSKIQTNGAQPNWLGVATKNGQEFEFKTKNNANMYGELGVGEAFEF